MLCVSNLQLAVLVRIVTCRVLLFFSAQLCVSFRALKCVVSLALRVTLCLLVLYFSYFALKRKYILLPFDKL